MDFFLIISDLPPGVEEMLTSEQLEEIIIVNLN